MSKLLNARGDLLQLLREARNTIVDIEHDFGNFLEDDDVAESLQHIRDTLATVLYELDWGDDLDEVNREDWLA